VLQNYFLLRIRSYLRKIGFTKFIVNILPKKEYEVIYSNALLSHVYENDFIYDIGANRGFYTRKFLEKSTKGKVFAFEPVPVNFSIISKLQSEYRNLYIYPIGLGSEKGSLPMSIGLDDLNATSSLKNFRSENDIMVTVETLDDIVNESHSVPNIIKIDVEGFEFEVLKGMSNTVINEKICVIAIEVHFSLLEKIGYQNGPKLVVDFLKSNNFKVNWIDPSHIIALRGRE
jgi:FkbM family methyltransferase